MGAYKVCRYDKREDYLNPEIRGKVIVSGDSWEEAEDWRNHFREWCPDSYYNITHSTSVAVIDTEESDGSSP